MSSSRITEDVHPHSRAAGIVGSRFFAGGHSFEVTEIESVEIVEVPTAATGPILMIPAGLAFLAAAAGDIGLIGIPIGLGLIAGAAIWWERKTPTFQLRLHTDGGDWWPVEDKDRSVVESLAVSIEAARRKP